MVSAASTAIVVILSLPLVAIAASHSLSQVNETQTSFDRVCHSISSAISSASSVYYPGMFSISHIARC